MTVTTVAVHERTQYATARLHELANTRRDGGRQPQTARSRCVRSMTARALQVRIGVIPVVSSSLSKETTVPSGTNAEPERASPRDELDELNRIKRGNRQLAVLFTVLLLMALVGVIIAI